MHSKRKGNIGEMHVASYLTKLGFSVFKELGDISKIDLITEVGKNTIKIQVKYISLKRGGFTFTTRKCSNKYQYFYEADDVDVFAVYCAEENKIVWLLASDVVCSGENACVTFRSKECRPKNNQTSKIRYIEDYEDFHRVVVSRLFPGR